ncbi:MAG: T9SS type A sorting domain-containing protein [Bacteroidales bacterium]|nr:T9SS type A sorting domain-containing protein [Bacteroidales bacterium]
MFILSGVMCLLSLVGASQNIIQLNDAYGATGDTVCVPVEILNSEAFISFQFDVVLPDGFTYVPSSATLSERCNNHLLSVNLVEQNTIRILSYSTNNTPYLSNNGKVLSFQLSTPVIRDAYEIGLENGIIGNQESVNILDSLVGGTVNLSPAGFKEGEHGKHKIKCYPNPFINELNISLNTGKPQTGELTVYGTNGQVLSSHSIDLNRAGEIRLKFNPEQLLGSVPTSGIYFLQFNFSDSERIVERIQFQKN